MLACQPKPWRRLVEAAGVEPTPPPIFLNDFNRIILGWTTYVQLFMINHLKMSVNRDKILKQIIPPINRYLSIKIPSQMITLWKLLPARADAFFKPRSIPLKWSRQVANRAGRFVLPLPIGCPGTNRGPKWNDRCWTGGLVYLVWLCGWTVVWRLF